jgi:hypothetical protein
MSIPHAVLGVFLLCFHGGVIELLSVTLKSEAALSTDGTARAQPATDTVAGWP